MMSECFKHKVPLKVVTICYCPECKAEKRKRRRVARVPTASTNEFPTHPGPVTTYGYGH